MLGFPRTVSPNTKQSHLTRVFGSAHLLMINIIHSPIGECKVHIGDTGTEVSGDNSSLDWRVPELVRLGICYMRRSGGTLLGVMNNVSSTRDNLFG